MTRPTQPLRLLQLGAIVMALIIATLVLAALIYVREQSRREHTDAVQDLGHAVSLALDAWVGTIDYGLQVSADEIGHQTGTHGADAAAINRFLARQQERFPYIACCARPTPRAKRSGAGAWTPRSVPAWPIRVFGSMRRGDGSDDSDVDLLVPLSPGTSGLALGGLLLDAQELLGRRVDVVTERWPCWRRSPFALTLPRAGASVPASVPSPAASAPQMLPPRRT